MICNFLPTYRYEWKMTIFHLSVLLCPSLVRSFSLFEVGQKLWNLITTSKSTHDGDCRFQLNRDVPFTPLILSAETPAEIIYPDDDDDDVIFLRHKGRLRLSCLDKHFDRSINGKSAIKDVTVTCVGGTTVSVGTRRYWFGHLRCNDFPTSVVRRAPQHNGTCSPNEAAASSSSSSSSLLEAGFEIDDGFLKIFTACFDARSQSAVYTWYDSWSVHFGHQYNVPRPLFADERLYTFKVDSAYHLSNQRSRMAHVLGSFRWAARFFANDHLHYLCRGHLSPKVDFVYGVQQSATFHFINAAPQWHIFNIGNWGRLEGAVRQFLLVNNDRRYRIVTGTYGVATLPDVNNDEQELYLYEDQNKNRLLRVPKLFWKIVRDMKEKDGVTIIGVNNPYLKSIPADYVICKNMCKEIAWLPEFDRDISKGYIYCCRVEEFLNVTGYDRSFIN